MTCIVGVRHGREIWLGGDGRDTDAADLSVYPSEPKVWRCGEYVMGHSGHGRGCQVMKHAFKPSLPSKDRSILSHMVMAFVPELRKALTGAGLQIDHEDEEADNAVRVAMLVGVRGRLFAVEPDWSVYEYPQFAATGCGFKWAVGSLSETDQKPPRDRVMRALKCAATYSAGVGRPFTIVRTP